jgi:hypothetical protein
LLHAKEVNRVCAIIVSTGSDEYMRKSLGPAAGANIAGVKAGTTAGVVTLVKDLKEGRSDDHEGRTWS